VKWNGMKGSPYIVRGLPHLPLDWCNMSLPLANPKVKANSNIKCFFGYFSP
jgi:hypothetical protein